MTQPESNALPRTKMQQRYRMIAPYVAGAQVLATQFMRCPQRGKDMVQDALEKALRTQHFPLKSKAKPWFLQVVRHRCLDELRLLQRHTDDSVLTELATQTHDSLPFVAQNLVQEALARLSPEQRDLLVLREFNDCSYADIATIVGIPEGTVMSRLHRARMAMRQALQQLGER
ncbi:RNA polymerase sigma factor [Pseudidiomarina sp. CB1]|uniref:RNA polymerase sigma factor n=1 Tax=Pseudidiomarina sp. CB1 TaxID=2972484 RepID=UPI0021616A5B|nr:RNA polymerase sigma factor [Pseudidiomarina sp. CB1]